MGEAEKQIVVDTDIFIDLFRGRKEAVAFFREHQEILFSAITEAELLAGEECNNEKKKENILHFLSQFEKIAVGNPLVQIAGDVRRTYKVLLPDAIVAATAITQNAILITRNSKDFEQIEKLRVKKPY